MDDAKPSVAPWHAQCEMLYREHGARLLRLCRLLLRNPQEAEDVVQAVFLKFVEYDAGSGHAMAWGPWLTRVAINACRDRQRAAWWRLWDRTAEEIEREVFVLRHIEAWPTQDTAEALGLSTGSVKRHLF